MIAYFVRGMVDVQRGGIVACGLGEVIEDQAAITTQGRSSVLGCEGMVLQQSPSVAPGLDGRCEWHWLREMDGFHWPEGVAIGIERGRLENVVTWLKRRDFAGGRDVRLIDGRVWQIPKLSALPGVLVRSGGAWYTEQNERAARVYAELAEVGRDPSRVLIDLVVMALGLNYRVGAAELTLLRSLHSSDMRRIVMALIDEEGRAGVLAGTNPPVPSPGVGS
jgi:hypothetical protein